MSTTNFGNQVQSFDYKTPGKSEVFNKLNYKIIEKGIYEGGSLTYNDATHIDIAPLVCYITDSATGIGVRVETTTSVTLEVSSGAPFIIARMAWNNVENNYMDLLAVGFGSILTDDLIIGRCLYPSGSLSATFDYARRSTALTKVSSNKKTDLTVIPTEPYSDQVYVYGGTFFNSEKMITVTGSNSSAFSGVNPNTITDARIDLVYIDDAGAIQIEEGVDEASPTVPKYNSRKVLAEIYLDSTDTYIDGTSITLVNTETVLGDEGLKALDDYANPIGTIKMFDANNSSGASGNSGAWVDNVTLPGWYACISDNSDQSCPNLVDTFIMGKIIAGNGSTGGSNTHTISISELPTHTHTINHDHPAKTSANNNLTHTHTYSHVNGETTSPDYYDNGTYSWNTSVYTTSNNNRAHTHSVDLDDFSGSSGDGDFSNTEIDIRPAYYSVIYIRKCS